MSKIKSGREVIEPREFMSGRVRLFDGDCTDVLRAIPDDSIDSCVTDPPYHLTNSGRKKPPPSVEGSPFSRHRMGINGDNQASRGFMGKEWDGGDIAFRPELWAEVLRVLKPGAHIVAFSGTRTYHRMACAIEDAGFEIRDQLQWLYGTGFPKSRNQKDDWQGWGTALKPACEPICLARKPLSEKTVAANLLRWGTGALNIDGCRVGTERREYSGGMGRFNDQAHAQGYRPYKDGVPNHTDQLFVAIGRWPANVVHDGSDEVLAGFPDSAGSGSPRQLKRSAGQRNGDWGMNATSADTAKLRDAGSGTAARFFYSAKASKADRMGFKHPTVKPVKLMRWLCRLVTPPGGVVLDPFAGTGTTGQAACNEGFGAVLIEREYEYVVNIRQRLGLLTPDEIEIAEQVDPAIARYGAHQLE